LKIELSDLANVKGIGKKTIERIKKQINYKQELKEERNVDLQVNELETNVIHNMDNIKGMRQLIPDNSIDLTVTSPPYDNLRDYEQYDFNFKDLAKELYRVTKDGGIVVWVVNDATINGSETGTSFKQALYFKKIGFNIHDTMLYRKNSPAFPAKKEGNRYTQIFEYMFIFSKGKPRKANLIRDKKNKWEGHKDFSGKLKNPVPKYSPRNNIWEYVTSFNDRTEHPAPFPEKLAEDHIKSWSNEEDIVLDPFMGSGTTAKMAKKLNRKYVGFEISEKYCEIIKERLVSLDKTQEG
jgi:site-specific DNA-methyltransferase (adenine-specific)